MQIYAYHRAKYLFSIYWNNYIVYWFIILSKYEHNKYMNSKYFEIWHDISVSRPLNSQYFFQLIAYFIFYWYFIGPKLPASFYVHRLCIPKIRSFWQIWIYKEICSASWILFCNASNKYYFYWSKWDQRFNMTLTALFSNVCLLFQNTWNVK